MALLQKTMPAARNRHAIALKRLKSHSTGLNDIQRKLRFSAVFLFGTGRS